MRLTRPVRKAVGIRLPQGGERRKAKRWASVGKCGPTSKGFGRRHDGLCGVPKMNCARESSAMGSAGSGTAGSRSADFHRCCRGRCDPAGSLTVLRGLCGVARGRAGSPGEGAARPGVAGTRSSHGAARAVGGFVGRFGPGGPSVSEGVLLGSLTPGVAPGSLVSSGMLKYCPSPF